VLGPANNFSTGKYFFYKKALLKFILKMLNLQ